MTRLTYSRVIPFGLGMFTLFAAFSTAGWL